MEQQYKEIISSLGEDINRDGLKNTPERAAKALRFLTQGYQQSIEKIVNGALFESDSDEMIIVKDIELYSLCEHHLRIVDMYARRLQVQERLTKQIADTVATVTQASGVGVIIEAKHLCMMMRGVEKQNSVMTTSVMLGTFRQDRRTRSEFLSLVQRHTER
jgi:GTP cyclohydrolase I